MKYFDAHTHLHDDKYNEDNFTLDEILFQAKEKNVVKMIDVGCDLESSIKCVDTANRYDNVYAAIGIHPNDVSKHTKEDLFKLEKLIKNSKVLAVGEIGLDYYWNEDVQNQKYFFEKQIELALKYDKLVMLHIRDKNNSFKAYYDAINILKKFKVKKIMLHCLTVDFDIASLFLEIGAYISIGGISTFKNALGLKDAIKKIPLNKIVVETDAPYLTPHPFRGKTNYPKYIEYTVNEIAILKNLDLETVAENIYKNTLKLFDLNI